MINGISTKRITGDNSDIIAQMRIDTLRRSLGFINNGYILSNYESNAQQFFINEIDYLLTSLQNERIILWTSHLTADYKKLCDEAGGVCIELSDNVAIPSQASFVIIVAPGTIDAKVSSLKMLSQQLITAPRRKSKRRTHLYIDHMDIIFKAEALSGNNDAIIAIDNILSHARRSNVVLTGTLLLPMVHYCNCLYYARFLKTAAFLLSAGNISLFDAEELSMVCGIPTKKVYEICNAYETTILVNAPYI